MLARWLRLWFGFTDPVDRRTYLRHGLGMKLFKYIQTLAEEAGTR
jgi:hypothetical protein